MSNRNPYAPFKPVPPTPAELEEMVNQPLPGILCLRDQSLVDPELPHPSGLEAITEPTKPHKYYGSTTLDLFDVVLSKLQHIDAKLDRVLAKLDSHK